jgi:hypothetical protein
MPINARRGDLITQFREIARPAFDRLRRPLQADVVARRAEITAGLNLYHELRGSPHRHGIREGWERLCSGELARLREEVSKLA